MREEIWLRVLGLSARVGIDDPDLAGEVHRAWSACLEEPGDKEPDITIEAGLTISPGGLGVLDERASRSAASLAAQLQHLTQTLTVTAIESLAGERLMLHACAVAQGDEAVVFVGPSGMGKTTVACILGRRWAYVTDECVAVGDDGLVTPFPKPLSIVGDGPIKTQMAPGELGLVPATSPARPAGLFLLRRDPGASSPELELVSTVQAVALLAEQVSFLPALDRPLARLAAFVRQAGGLKVLTYSEASHLDALVESLLGADE